MGQIDFLKTIESLKVIGFNPIPNRVQISIPNAKEELMRGLRFFEGERAEWLPEYDEVAEWLSDNKQRGLLCYGNCGRGKTLICGKIIPMLLNHYCGKCIAGYTALQMNEEVDRVKKMHIIGLDDIGQEMDIVDYGNRRKAFCEIVDEAERKGKLLIITTNLSLAEINSKYGERTKDRLVAITKRVKFLGKSLRE